MITLNEIANLSENDGMTLKNGKPIVYKSGYQVALDGCETTEASEAFEMVKRYNFNCGIWFSKGVYYIDNSIRVATKREALLIGKLCKQISVLKWSNMSLVYC